METEFKPNYAIHPGVFLKDEMEMLDVTQKTLAEETGVSKTIINEVIKGKRRISAELAIKLEKVLNSPAKYWLNLQALYDEAVARQKLESVDSKNYIEIASDNGFQCGLTPNQIAVDNGKRTEGL